MKKKGGAVLLCAVSLFLRSVGAAFQGILCVLLLLPVLRPFLRLLCIHCSINLLGCSLCLAQRQLFFGKNAPKRLSARKRVIYHLGEENPSKLRKTTFPLFSCLHPLFSLVLCSLIACFSLKLETFSIKLGAISKLYRIFTLGNGALSLIVCDVQAILQHYKCTSLRSVVVLHARYNFHTLF